MGPPRGLGQAGRPGWWAQTLPNCWSGSHTAPQPLPSKPEQNTTKNKHRKTDTSDTHRSKVTRSTSTDAAQDLTRHGRRGARPEAEGGSKSLSVQLQKSAKRTSGRALWSLAACFFFFLF